MWGYKSQNLRELQAVQYNNNIVVRISSGFGELALSFFFFFFFSPDRPGQNVAPTVGPFDDFRTVVDVINPLY